MGFLERIMGIQTAPDLRSCEQRIERGLAGYRDAGEALREIRDGRLYRQVADTFESYCRSRWKMEPQHAARLIDAAAVANNLSPAGEIPKTERVARPLTKLPADQQLQAWAEATEAAAPADPTSKHVEAAVARRRKPSRKSRPKSVRLKVPGAIVIVEPGRGFITVEEALFEALRKVGAAVERVTVQDAA